MRIFGFFCGHDTSFCVLNDGKVEVHTELERHIREKEPKGDAIAFARQFIEPNDCDVVVTTYPSKFYDQNPSKVNKNVFHVSHHTAHAAHAFYSSKFNDAAIITIDGGGVEDDHGLETATTVRVGHDTKMSEALMIHPHQINIGGLWTRVTRYIFKLQNGWPKGHQAGTVMAMAALGDSNKYKSDFYTMLTRDITPASVKPKDQPVGAYVPGKDPIHPYLNKWSKIADESEQEKFHLAAGLQAATEDLVAELIDDVLKRFPETTNLCFSGGVALNSVAMGKVKKWFPQIEGVYIPPVPYDGGLPIGAAQYYWHHVLGNDRVKWDNNLMPYTGVEYTRADVEKTLSEFTDRVNVFETNDEAMISELESGKIVSVYYGRAESGRRALGHRSILADPRNPDMKDIVNEKVKHRQWFRPFAPSVLREDVPEWFNEDIESPYMSFVAEFRDEVKDKVPAVVHFDGTARLQTVTENDCGWYYRFIKKWKEKTGVPMVLNSSLNDCLPICECPKDAIQCFLGTKMDYVYFPEFGIAIKKNEQ